MSKPDLSAIAAEANRLDAIGQSAYGLHKWSNVAVGKLLLPVVDSFASPCAADAWLEQHFAAGADRAKACITFARLGVPGEITAFDQMALDGTLGDHLEELIERTKESPAAANEAQVIVPPAIAEIGARLRVHCQIVQHLQAPLFKAMREAGSVVMEMQGKLPEAEYIDWINRDFAADVPGLMLCATAAQLSDSQILAALNRGREWLMAQAGMNPEQPPPVNPFKGTHSEN